MNFLHPGISIHHHNRHNDRNYKSRIENKTRQLWSVVCQLDIQEWPVFGGCDVFHLHTHHGARGWFCGCGHQYDPRPDVTAQVHSLALVLDDTLTLHHSPRFNAGRVRRWDYVGDGTSWEGRKHGRRV